MAGPEFRRDLHRGTAPYYDRFRPPYPEALVDDVLARAQVSGQGRLLDLACGTGQICFAMYRSFREVWAVDREPDMVAFTQRKADAMGIRHIRFEAADAEDLVAPEASFELVAVGNAFHRLRREVLATRALGWLVPGGCIALLWSDSPWVGEAPWQKALSATLDRWRAPERVPAGWDQARRERPDLAVLQAAGFEPARAQRFATVHVWTAETLIGFVYSTSFFPRESIGDRFEQDLRSALHAAEPSGRFPQTVGFACELARRPPQPPVRPRR